MDENLSNEYFIDYFLNRISIDTFNKQIKSNKKLTNIYEAFKYAFFNNITNNAGMHYLILGAKNNLQKYYKLYVNMKNKNIISYRFKKIVSYYTIIVIQYRLIIYFLLLL